MDKAKILRRLEYLLIVCSLIGSCITVVTKRAAYAAFPITATLGLNAVNRRDSDKKLNALKPLGNGGYYLHGSSYSHTNHPNYLEGINRGIAIEKLGEDINSIKREICDLRCSLRQNSLPSAEFEKATLREIKITDLNNNEDLETVIHKIEDKLFEIETRYTPVTKFEDNISSLEDTIKKLENKLFHAETCFTPITKFEDAISEVNSGIENISSREISELKLSNSLLNDRIDNLNNIDFESLIMLQNQINNVFAVLETVNSLQEKHDDLYERLLLLESEESAKINPEANSKFKYIFELAEKIVYEIIRFESSFSNLQSRVSKLESSLVLENEVFDIKKLFDIHSDCIDKFNFIKSEYSNFIKSYDEISSNLRVIVRDDNNRFDKVVEFYLKNTVGKIAVDSYFVGLASKIESQFNRRLRVINPYEHKFIINRDESHKILLESLDNSKERLIIVCPWVNDKVVNDQFVKKLTYLLENSCTVSIGWGNYKDIYPNTRVKKYKHQLISESKQRMRNKGYDWKYSGVHSLLDLQTKFDNLELKLMGTHEKFIVCDKKFTYVGSHNILTSTDASDERELGIKTDNYSLINQLIEIFDKAEDHDYSVEDAF